MFLWQNGCEIIGLGSFGPRSLLEVHNPLQFQIDLLAT